jgi:indolepyruvate ferredoxin oxidoreductase alpha subunit
VTLDAWSEPADPTGAAPAATQSAARGLATDLLAAGVATFLTVPGHPATELMDELERLGARVDDAHDEKTAAEMAFGMSVAGVPVGVLVKGNGALLAAEPLQNAGPHGCGAPLLLVVGDDVRARSSTVPTDARPLGEVLLVPVFDLPVGGQRRPAVAAAVAASASTRRPVIVRFTGELVARSVPPEPPQPVAARPAASVDPARALTPTKLARFLDYGVNRAPELADVARRAPRRLRPGRDRCGIVASGALWDTLVLALPEDRAEPALGLTCVHPLPEAVVEFCQGLDRVLVLEEGRPVVEDAVQLALARAGFPCLVEGQRSGVVPALGASTVAEVLDALEGVPAPAPLVQARPADRDTALHPFRVLFEALSSVRDRREVDIQSCVGSCISAAYPPWSLASTALNLGGSTGVAAGVARAPGRPGIALIGDYGLVHSGLSALDQIHQWHLPVLTIVLDNGVSAKTGGQPSAVGRHQPGREPLDVGLLVSRAAPGRPVRTLDVADVDGPALAEVIEELLADAPATLVVTAPADR